MGKDAKIIGYVSTIENFFEEKWSKYHEIMFVHRVEFVDEEDKRIEDTLKNIEGREELQYEWIDIDRIDEYNVVPVAIREVLKEKNWPVHRINYEIKEG